MADQPQQPLLVSLRERLKDKHRQELSRRIAPPTSVNVATVHRLPVVDKPEEPPTTTELTEAMAKKDKRGFYTPEYKAKIVARLLEAKEAGTPTQQSILDAEEVSGALAYKWIKDARAANGQAPKKKRQKRADKTTQGAALNGKKPERDLQSIVSELREAKTRFLALKEELLAHFE